MRLVDAIRAVQSNDRRELRPFQVFLGVGFTPLHLKTYLVAHLASRLPTRKIECRIGLYGDVAGTLESADAFRSQAVAVVLEWPDVDPRLGYRRLGSWDVKSLENIVASAPRRLETIAKRIERLAGATRVALALPCLPLPPVFTTPSWQTTRHEFELRRAVTEFAEACAGRGVLVVSSQKLAAASPPEGRHDLRSDLAGDFPYQLGHASALADALASLLLPSPPLKGIISDLDDTLWRGLVGEIGPDAVSWDLDHQSQGHALYQQTLAALADAGILIAVASKNSPEIVDRALARRDLHLPADRIFPVEVGWSAKSGAVQRTLELWNFASDSVLFIDDSPMELAEVERHVPGIRTVRFPTHDENEILRLLRQLRDWCGKETITEEDAIRLQSIRASARMRAPDQGHATSSEFLRELNPELTADFRKDLTDPRPLELVNKTNQFNLNGNRIDPTEWRRFLSSNDSFLLTLSYADKFGPLGKISVVTGTRDQGSLNISCWVLSCRAFSRQIEHRTLALLFEHFGVPAIRLDYAATERNGPLTEFLASVASEPPAPGMVVRAKDFADRVAPFNHAVIVHADR